MMSDSKRSFSTIRMRILEFSIVTIFHSAQFQRFYIDSTMTLYLQKFRQDSSMISIHDWIHNFTTLARCRRISNGPTHVKFIGEGILGLAPVKSKQRTKSMVPFCIALQVKPQEVTLPFPGGNLSLKHLIAGIC